MPDREACRQNDTKPIHHSCDVALLGRIYRDARIGAETTDTLLTRTSSPALAASMIRQMYRYRAFAHTAQQKLHERGVPAKRICPLMRANIHFGTIAHTLLDESSSHIAELMINGSTMGIIDMTKAVQTIPGSQEVRQLGRDLLELEQNNIEQMKRYLY